MSIPWHDTREAAVARAAERGTAALLYFHTPT